MIAVTPLAAGEVHVWCASIADEPLLADVLPLLDGEERASSNRFRFEADRARAIIGRGTLRRLLGHYLDRPPQSLQFDVDAYGKPSLRGHDIAFNIAHSGRYVLLALSLHGRLGVDVEELREGNVADDCAHYFTATEQRVIHALPAPARPREFFRLWTRKEACLKATGMGLSLPLDAFDSSTDRVQLPSGETLQVVELDIAEDHLAAFATSIENPRTLLHAM